VVVLFLHWSESDMIRKVVRRLVCSCSGDARGDAGVVMRVLSRVAARVYPTNSSGNNVSVR